MRTAITRAFEEVAQEKNIKLIKSDIGGLRLGDILKASEMTRLILWGENFLQSERIPTYTDKRKIKSEIMK